MNQGERFEGYLDHVDGGNLHGWARSIDYPDTPVAVHIFHEAEQLGTVSASQFREDLRRAGIGNGRGYYGFTFPLSERVRALGRYSLRGLVNGNELTNCPLEVQDTWYEFRKTVDIRNFLSEQYLTGCGMEVGALNKPNKVALALKSSTWTRSPQTSSWRCMRLSCRAIQPFTSTWSQTEIRSKKSPPIHRIFSIANQVLEHLENPLLALQNMLRVVKRGGIVFLSRRTNATLLTWIARSPASNICGKITSRAPAWSRETHYREWIRLVEKLEVEPETLSRLNFLMNDIQYPIHYHVWTQFEMFEMLVKGRDILRYPFEIECFKANGYESLFVLRKL